MTRICNGLEAWVHAPESVHFDQQFLRSASKCFGGRRRVLLCCSSWCLVVARSCQSCHCHGLGPGSCSGWLDSWTFCWQKYVETIWGKSCVFFGSGRGKLAVCRSEKNASGRRGVCFRFLCFALQSTATGLWLIGWYDPERLGFAGQIWQRILLFSRRALVSYLTTWSLSQRSESSSWVIESFTFCFALCLSSYRRNATVFPRNSPSSIYR